jgi:hypothetical protein
MWQDIINAKYLKGKPLTGIKSRVTDSPSWKAIMKVGEIYYSGRRVALNNGDICRVWKDHIHDGVPFSEKFPELIGIFQEQDCIILWRNDTV